MPRRKDIRKVLIIGSGPIIIGQACEFDYSGTQACKALREEGYEIVLVNSNPATIMTDPGMADRTYIEPLTVESLEKIIEKERPDGLLPNLGGQTGLNLASALHKAGILQKYGVDTLVSALGTPRPSPESIVAGDLSTVMRMFAERPISVSVEEINRVQQQVHVTDTASRA